MIQKIDTLDESTLFLGGYRRVRSESIVCMLVFEHPVCLIKCTVIAVLSILSNYSASDSLRLEDPTVIVGADSRVIR